ncbi:AAA family ATPase [Nocardioides jishulii]|uniref:MinD/ParA family protein n=1 Tax=Nocardioides jishulii TaxID=2575440 RepID=A0A4U2YKC0_9ACTN|nr:AAA family ATPase [Nocardioides jishulii]QCX27143.1 MinD/ParA family protein [Nocardioides jishulii]TKI61627.1 MinD/ParA family protein [Nocardioides jishulii]
MPILLGADPQTAAHVLTVLPQGSQVVDSAERLFGWLNGHPDEYAVLIGPSVGLPDAMALAERMRTTMPTTTVVLLRQAVDTATLTQAMHAGVREVVAAQDLAQVGQAIQRAHGLAVALRGNQAGGRGHEGGRVVTIFSPKGGVGKTTMSVNLGIALMRGGENKVCVVDLDLAFGDIAITLQLFPTHSIEHAIGGETYMDEQFIQQLMTPHESGLMILAAPSAPDARERVSGVLIARLLQTLREQYDYIVLDTAPAFDEQTLTALDETDECIIVATLDVPTLKNVKVALETLDVLGVAEGHRHLLLNRADEQVGIGADKVEGILGMNVAVQVATSLDIAKATNAGRPLMLSSPSHPSSQALRSLADRLMGIDSEFSATPPAPRTSSASATAPAASDKREDNPKRFRISRR